MVKDQYNLDTPSEETNDQELKNAWSNFIASLTDEEKRRLIEEGNFDLANPTSENMPMFHRTVEPFDSRKVKDGKGGDYTTYWTKINANLNKVQHPRDEKDPVMDFAITIASRIVDAFDCSKDKRVRMHADCFRMAIGYTDENSVTLAKKYGTKKQNIHWHVKSIRKRIGIT